jgi:hypothetical protein
MRKCTADSVRAAALELAQPLVADNEILQHRHRIDAAAEFADANPGAADRADVLLRCDVDEHRHITQSA